MQTKKTTVASVTENDMRKQGKPCFVIHDPTGLYCRLFQRTPDGQYIMWTNGSTPVDVKADDPVTLQYQSEES